VPTQLAVYGQAAIAYGPTAGDDLKPLIDLLTDEVKGYARLATVNALASWVAQAPGHTALLEQQLAAKIRRENEPEIICRLLRGSVAPDKPDPAELDRLLGYLTDPSVAVRELAQWNLINFVDPSAARTPGLVVDVAVPGPAYDKYVKAWKARVAEIENRPPMKK
jgi:HEAT repeat protein